IGAERSAFLHVSDILPRSADIKYNSPAFEYPKINSLIVQDEEILVQVLKSPIGTKGARVTANITLPSRYLILTPSSDNVSISHQIFDEKEKARLKNVFTENIINGLGVIIRTVATGIDSETLLEEYNSLVKLWAQIKIDSISTKGVRLIYKEPSLINKIFRDIHDLNLDEILIDDKAVYEESLEFAGKYIPNLLPKIKLYNNKLSLFESFNVEKQIEGALSSRVNLESGGYIVIDQTESMTTIDVNTGSYVGSNCVESTIFKTNEEAAKMIAYQAQLRNLGGIIIVDFIDMQLEENKENILTILKKVFEDDRGKTNILGFTRLGLVEMTRKRTRKSLEHLLYHKCSKCNGVGSVKTIETIAHELVREVLKICKTQEVSKLNIEISDSLAKYFNLENTKLFELIKENISVPFEFINDKTLCYNKYNIVSEY
ncbi:MAG: Rne/Rng family ribonuclease, partial [Psittacicella sp.]